MTGEKVENRLGINPSAIDEALPKTLIESDDQSNENIAEISAMTSTNPGKTECAQSDTMQILLDSGKSLKPIQKYPAADTLALMLILGNLPSLLITGLQLLYSVQHFSFGDSSTASLISSPTSIILSIDLLLVLFTTFAAPQTRFLYLDISYTIIASTISGIDLRNTLPAAILLAAIRIFWTQRLPSPAIQSIREIGSTKLAHQSIHSSWTWSWIRDRSIASMRDLSAGYLIPDKLQYLNILAAIHICVLCLIQYTMSGAPTLKSDHDVSSCSKLRKKAVLNAEPKNVPRISFWDHLLRLRAETDGRRHELSLLAQGQYRSEAWISHISARSITFSLMTQPGRSPEVTVHVNGLIWDVKLAPADPINFEVVLPAQERATDKWNVLVDNLSAKTEYDISLEIYPDHIPKCHYFNVCTSIQTQLAGRARAESLPPIQTNVSAPAQPNMNETFPGGSETTLNHISGPFSPTTTLEESVSVAHERLEEKRLLLRRMRKDNSKRIQQLQREYDHMTSKVHGTNDKSEQRLQGRMLSLQTEIRRIQDHTDEMENKKLKLTSTHELQVKIWTEEKQRRDHEAVILDKTRIHYNSVKEEYEKHLGAIETEAVKIKARADKLSLRRTKIQQDLDRCSQDQDDILNREYHDRNNARELVKMSRLQTEAEYLKMIHELQQRIDYLELYGLPQ